MRKAKEHTPIPVAVTGCVFTGVHYDAKACEAIQTIAQALNENAKGLHALAQVLNGSHVKIDSLLNVGT